MQNKCKNATAAFAASLFLSVAVCGTALADNLSPYKNMLLNKVYTIKYLNVTSEARQTNKDKITLMGSNYMDTRKIDQLTYKPTESIIVSDGDTRYEEIGTNQFTSCRLQRGNDMYVFSRLKVKGVLSWFGNKKGEIISTPTNRLAILEQGDSFGNETVTRMLNAFLPNDQKASGMPSYNKVGEGTLPNALNYVDYRSADSGNFEVIRYYFNGTKLVKIASGIYVFNNNGEIVDGKRNIVDIIEFSPTADKSLLKLPEGLKDKSKKGQNDMDEDDEDEKEK